MIRISVPLVAMALLAGCSSDPAEETAGAPLTCENPGKAGTVIDKHCLVTQVVEASACTSKAPAPAEDGAGGRLLHGDGEGHGGGMVNGCEYSTTVKSTEADDDECKYHVSWTAGDLCQGDAGVEFQVTVVEKATGATVSIPNGLETEVYVPADPAAACDSVGTHASPLANPLVETAAGSGVYTGRIAFDRSGPWTMRFHIHEECLDELASSPHGHVAFRLTLP